MSICIYSIYVHTLCYMNTHYCGSQNRQPMFVAFTVISVCKFSICIHPWSYIYRNINEFCAVPNLAVIVVATGIKPQQSHYCVRVSARRDNSIGPTTQRHEMVDCSVRISKFYFQLLSDADRAMFFG